MLTGHEVDSNCKLIGGAYTVHSVMPMLRADAVFDNSFDAITASASDIHITTMPCNAGPEPCAED